MLKNKQQSDLFEKYNDIVSDLDKITDKASKVRQAKLKQFITTYFEDVLKETLREAKHHQTIEIFIKNMISKFEDYKVNDYTDDYIKFLLSDLTHYDILKMLIDYHGEQYLPELINDDGWFYVKVALVVFTNLLKQWIEQLDLEDENLSEDTIARLTAWYEYIKKEVDISYN